jgi:hypothetical protein
MKSTIHKDNKEKDWFRLKRYPHIGLQLESKDRAWIEPYVKDKEAISKHAFYPFIHRKLKVRKFRKEICHDGTRSNLRKPAIKEREIYFSNHLDSNVFSYYSEILSIAYEREISELDISKSITAYRKIKLHPEKDTSRNKCNIDFANDIFKFIKSNKEQDLVAITFDIKSFFDNLDHRLLKKYWKRIINSGADLPEDHYNVFRNITKFSYIDEDDIFENFQSQIIVERKPKLFKEIRIKKRNYLRNKRAVAYCTKDNIDEIRSLGLIKTNKRIKDNGEYEIRTRGIPQGSPISATLANVYMLDFDKQAHEMLKSIGGVYQRYSDDMVAICPVSFEQEVVKSFLSSIQEYKLEIQKSKTQVFHFIYDKRAARHFCHEKNLNTNRLQNNTLFEYLGFQFDGFNTLIKCSSLSNYYRKMKRTFARSKFYTFHNRTATKGQVFKTRLYKKFTHVGANRRRIYQRHPNKSDVFIKSHRYDWGNFITYARLAEKTIIDNKIGGQVKRHWRKFHELMKTIEFNENKSH